MSNRYSYQAIIDRPQFLWPGNAGVALWVIPNIEYYPFGNQGPAINAKSAENPTDVLNSSWRDYGPRVGVWRLIDCFDRTGVKVSATLNSEVCDQYPRVIQAGRDRGWEWLGHGTNNTVRLSELSPEDEPRLVVDATDRITEATGTPPRGWLGPSLAESAHTPEVLQDAGYRYVCDWLCDDLPVWISTDDGRILSVPYNIELNDMQMIFRQRSSGPEYLRALVDHFEQLRSESRREGRGRVMAIPVHPFLAGQARFCGYLEQALETILRSGDAWSATGGEIADFFIQATDQN